MKNVTSEHMQEYLDLLSFGGKAPDGTEARPLSTFNPMQYVVIRRPTQQVDLFGTGDEDGRCVTDEDHYS